MLSFANATGNLFNRLGKLGAVIANIYAHQQLQYAAMTSTATGIVAQYNSESDLQALIGNSYISNLTGCESPSGTMQQLAAATFNRMVFRDNPQLNQTLTTSNIVQSIQEVIRQMKIANATVYKTVVSASPATMYGTGNGAIISSVLRPLDGLMLENLFAENIMLTCSQDSYTGNATAGNETFSITGEGAETDLFAFDWPLGSNATNSLKAISSTSNNNGNLLTNSDFDNWTSGVPSNYTLVVGNNIAQETGIVYSGTSALRITGDGSTLTCLTQQFGLSAGTLGTIAPQTQYSFNIFLRCGPTPPAAGVLTIDLVDQNNNVINDAAGNPNSFNINLTGLNTVYTPYNGVFRIPLVVPTSVFLRMRLTTPVSNGAVIYADRSSFGQMTQFYTSGPFLSLHSGATPFVLGDYGTLATSNARGIGGTLTTFQTLLFRLLAPTILQNEFLFPSSLTPSISDSLIA